MAVYLSQFRRHDPAADQTAAAAASDPVLARIICEMASEREPEPVAMADPSAWQADGAGFLSKQLDRPPRGSRLIHGIASSDAINSHTYALLAAGVEVDLPVPILFGHKGHSAPIGEVFYARKGRGRLYIRAAIFDNAAGDHAWRLVESGEVRCLSGAGRTLKLQGEVDGVRFYEKWKLVEVSLCRVGANPDSVFEPWKPGDSGFKFHTIDRVKDLLPCDR